ncbi:Endoribonuclease [Aphelenchoides besseyi]|nr:Endoribonuclease [Aphelenchoides besseyi]
MSSRWILVLSVLIPLLTALQVSNIPQFTVNDVDLRKLVVEMQEKDAERPGFCDFLLDYQGHFDGNNQDYAKENLYKVVRPQILQKPSFAQLLDLRSLFNPKTGVAEIQSPEKEAKINDFYDTVWSSAPFQLVVKLLKEKGHPWAKAEPSLKESIKQIWFGLYSRAGGKLDSCAFEHVFFGEEKNNEVSGLHNWAIIHQLENDPNNRLDYRGFIVKRTDVIASANFKWGNFEKKTGSFFANTSPAFDFSVLTICFLTHRDKSKCVINIDGCDVEVQSYELLRNGLAFIGTVYPEPSKMTPECNAGYKKKSKCCGEFQKLKKKKQ